MACIVSFRSLFAQRDQQSQRREIAQRRRSVYNPYRGGSSSDRTPWQSGNGSRGNLPAGIRKRFVIFQDNVLDTCATLEGVTLNDEDPTVEMPDLRARSDMERAAGQTGDQAVLGQDQKRAPGTVEPGREHRAEGEGTSSIPPHHSSRDDGGPGNRQRESVDSYLVGEEPSPVSSGRRGSHSVSGRSSQGRQPSVDSLIIQGGVSPTSPHSRWHENL